MQEIAGLLSLRDPYAQAAKDAKRLTGLSLNAASLHREARRQGQRAIQLRQRDIDLAQSPQGVVQLSARSETSQLGPFTLIIEIDAWNIRERDDWGKTRKLRRQGKQPERWHWVFTATLFRLDQRGGNSQWAPSPFGSGLCRHPPIAGVLHPDALYRSTLARAT